MAYRISAFSGNSWHIMASKKIHYSCEEPLAITVCHHAASLVMPIGDPRDGFVYPTFTLMMDSYIIFFFPENEWQMRLIRLRAGRDRLVCTFVVCVHESQVFARSVRNDNCFYVVFHKGFLQMSCNI